ncbi:MAG: hypothetical protein SGJ11_03070 [Phycisphaerae bacterium]|nr:hypothetical protein [Phycisphaerae bacterium]
MRPNLILIAALALAPLAALSTLAGCEEKKPAATGSPSGTSTNKDDHAPDGSHTGEKKSEPGHGGAVIQLGASTIGSFNVKATRDEGQIVGGKDAPIDVTVTPAVGSTAKVTGVRFWIGTEDAKSSAKAKAEIEDPNDPNRWHTHAEIPGVIPAGSKLWVEIEDDKGDTAVGSFDLKA